MVIDIPNETPERWNEVTKSLNIEDQSFEVFVSFGNDLAVCSELSEEDIIASISTISKEMSREEAVGEDSNDEADSEAEALELELILRDGPHAIILHRFLQKMMVISDQVILSIAFWMMYWTK